MITAQTERAQITEAIASGVSSILVKPYTANDLLLRIKRAQAHRPQYLPMPASTQSVQVEPPTALGRPTLLVVDDMPDNLSLLVGLFQDQFRVLAAKDGLSALGICASNRPPDLVLLDVMMPNMDGFELAQRLRENAGTSRIPIIFVTAIADQDAQLRGLELGAVDFVHKPIEPATLHHRVVNLLRLVEQRNVLQQEFDSLVELERFREEASYISRQDLKAPLGNLVGIARALAQSGNLLPRQLQMVQTLEDDCQSLLAMVDLGSELCNIETGRFQLQAVTFDLQLMTRRICETTRLAYQAKGLSIELLVDDDRQCVVSADQLLCFSLINNLIKHACDAAPGSSRVRLQLTGEQSIVLVLEYQPAVPECLRGDFFSKHSSLGGVQGIYSARMLAEAQQGSLRLEVDDVADLTRLRLSLPMA